MPRAGAVARAQEKLALQSEVKPVARERSTRIAEAQAQAVAKRTQQAEAKPAARDRSTRIAERIEAQAQAAAKRTQQAEAKPAATVETLVEFKGDDACCAKVMNEFVKSSGKPPTLRDIRQVILPKVNAERELRKKPPILESTLVKHIRKWKQSAGYTWPGRKHQKTDDDSPDLRDLMNFHQQLDLMADLRVCAVCGEERGKHLFPTTLTYDPKRRFFLDRWTPAAKDS